MVHTSSLRVLLMNYAGLPADAWPITQGKVVQGHQEVYELKLRQCCKTGLVAVPASPPKLDGALGLVLSRLGIGRAPW